uniref:uncharacterized protein LOC120343244 n=1 Tax=Styela clava TaxID=7725 RepID=UPI00193A5CBF|nr:uncharacterized protein LOC120343244 [Styela clava]
MSKQEVTVKDVMEGKMVADSMLSSLFIDLNDVEKTNRGVQSFIHLMTTYPAITKLVSCFMSKIKKVPTYLSQCSSFQKRILLFIVVECLMLGEHIDLRFTSENLAPLETALIRLSDIALAFQNVIKHPNFCDIWHHTVKQAVIAFLRKKQSVEASKILVLYRDRINEEQKKMLEKLIERTLNKKLDIEKLARTDGHDYTSYYFVMATFIKGLNNQLPKTTLHRFAAKISTSVKEQNDEEDQYEDMVDSGSDMDHDGINMDEPPEEMEKNNEVDTTMEAEEDDTLIDVSSSDSGNVQEKIAKTKPLIEIPDSEEDQESDEDTTNDNNNMEKLDPKIGLTYRLKKQIHNSGIIIPCKHIVKHCREIHNEIEEIETGSSKQPYVKSKKKAYAPLTAEALSKAPYKPDISPRNLLLGERFEDLNSTFHSSVSSRTYSSRRRIPFTCDLDSYIVVGCRHFGIGQWTKH